MEKLVFECGEEEEDEKKWNLDAERYRGSLGGD
jgi:hypothetical protein